MNCPYASAHGYFCLLNSFIFFLQFSLHFREKFFWWAQGENTQISLFIFLPPHPPNTLKKKISFHFFSKVFHPPYFTSKQIHHQGLFGQEDGKVREQKSGRMNFFFFFSCGEKQKNRKCSLYKFTIMSVWEKKRDQRSRKKWVGL